MAKLVVRRQNTEVEVNMISNISVNLYSDQQHLRQITKVLVARGT